MFYFYDERLSELTRKEKNLCFIESIREGAENGDSLSQFKLGMLYIKGAITEYYYLQKMKCIILSGKKGDKETKEYEQQEKEDIKKGVYWLKKVLESNGTYANIAKEQLKSLNVSLHVDG